MLLLWACVVIVAITAAHRVVDSSEDHTTNITNTTTLFPVNTTAAADTSTIKPATSWKIETTFGESKLDSNSTDSKEELVLERPGKTSSSGEFRPSPLLSSYVEDHSYRFQPTKETPDAFSNVIKKPPTGFISSPKDAFKSPFDKLPKESFKNYQEFPYKFEPAIFTRAKEGWKPTGNPGAGPSGHTGLLDSRPTDEAPVRVPAGGLYKLPDPFKIKPGTTDDDFGLEFSGDVKENAVKKRVNPWSNLLRLLTALIPVGIIFSALTPSVITIQPEQSQGPNIVRRGDGIFSPPAISERCRRRLLCELQSETNYYRAEGRRIKQCHRLRCEDPAALASTLQWLLAHRPPHT